MNGDLVYHEVDGLAIADIKPVNAKNHRIGLRVAKFTCTPKSNSKTAYGYLWRYISHDSSIVKRDCD